MRTRATKQALRPLVFQHVLPRSPAGLGQLREIRIDEIGAEIDKSRCLHLQFNETERAVIEDDDLYRELELAQSQHLAQQHRQTAVTGKADDLSARMGCLRADCLRQGICHRAMGEGAHQPSPAIHAKIARSPDGGRTHVAGEDSVVRRKLINHPGDVLRGVSACGRARLLQDRRVPCESAGNA